MRLHEIIAARKDSNREHDQLGVAMPPLAARAVSAECGARFRLARQSAAAAA